MTKQVSAQGRFTKGKTLKLPFGFFIKCQIYGYFPDGGFLFTLGRKIK